VLRRLGETVKREAWDMPITTSILEHHVLAPVLKEFLLEGRCRVGPS
jgi:hypothetical protein